MSRSHDHRRESRQRDQLRNLIAGKYFKHLYSGIDGIALSHENRAPSDASDQSLTYGEVVHSSFLQILEFVRKSVDWRAGGTFVDLGCGTGKAVVIAALSTMSFSKVWGIELLEPLAACASRIADQLQQDLAIASDSSGEGPSCPKAIRPSKGKQATAPSAKEILSHILGLLLDSPHQILPCDAIVNSLCQLFGHKAYKSFIKKHGTFKKFVLLNSDVLSIEDNMLRGLSSVPNDAPRAEEVEVGGVHVDESEPEARSNDRFSYLENVTGCMSALIPLPKDIVIQRGDIFDIDWFSEASVVYCASLLFSEDMLAALLGRCLQMQVGSIFISLKPLPRYDDIYAPDRRLRLLSESFYRMSWQMAKVYIYEVVPISGDGLAS